MTRVACVIPAYEAEDTVAGVVQGIRAALPAAWVLVVDDGSTDATAAAASAFADLVVRFDHNRGKGAALRAGFERALADGADFVVTIDADGQHDPAAAAWLVDALADADVALGTRRRDRAMPFGRRVTNRLASAAVGHIVGAPVVDSQSGFRAVRRAVLERVAAVGDRYEFETDFLIRAGLAGFRIATVPIATTYGAASHFRGLDDAMRVIRTIWRHRAARSPVR